MFDAMEAEKEDEDPYGAMFDAMEAEKEDEDLHAKHLNQEEDEESPKPEAAPPAPVEVEEIEKDTGANAWKTAIPDDRLCSEFILAESMSYPPPLRLNSLHCCGPTDS